MTTSVQNRGRTTAVAAATVLALLAAGCTRLDRPGWDFLECREQYRCRSTSGSSAASGSSGFRSRLRNRLDLVR